MFMTRVCAWCGRRLGRVWCPKATKPEVTHGMCADCLAELYSELDDWRARQPDIQAPEQQSN